jgi:uncharacterized membrane protein
MGFADRFWLLFPRQLRTLPIDLHAVLVYVLVTDLAILLPVVSQTPIRVVLGLPFVLFVPGYAFIAALFPEASSEPATETGESAADESETESEPERQGIDGIERVALSFGLSIALVPLVGLVLNFTPFGIRLLPIIVSLSGLVVVLTVIAGRRRLDLPPEERFEVPYESWIVSARSEMFEPETRADVVLNVLLVLSVLLAAGSVTYAVAVPQQGESFSEFYLLTETDDGELVADDYPTEMAVDEQSSLVIGIGNQEHESVEYTVIEKLQRVQIRNNSTRVRAEQELSRYSTTVDANETVHRTHTVTPTMTGERLRLVYLLYKGSPPADPTINNSYREVHLWVNVSVARE